VNWVDWVILGVLGVAVISGMMRGAVRTIFSLAGVVVGFLVASRESGAVGMVLARWVPENVAAAIGFVLVFLGVAVAFSLVAWLLRRILEGLWLGWADRMLGAGLGLAQAAVALGIAALLVEGFGSFPDARRSTTYPWALRSGRILLGAIPPDTIERLNWDELLDQVPRLWTAPEEPEEEVI
jgi:membrane protein required for colicin V production